MDMHTLVSTLVVITKSAKLTEAQTYELVGRLTSSLLSELTGPVDAPLSTPATTQRGEALTRPVTPEIAPGGVKIPLGTVCTCALCEKVAYEVVEDVYENMKIPKFMACFKPPMSKDTDLWADPYGNVAVDCPLCKGRKTVWIVGKGDKLFSDYPENEVAPLSER